jgi:hypothetical protein
MPAVADESATAAWHPVYAHIASSNFAQFGPVVIQPERNTSPIASMSSSEIDGLENGRKSSLIPGILSFDSAKKTTFPMIGKMRGDSSNDWKLLQTRFSNDWKLFQCLETCPLTQGTTSPVPRNPSDFGFLKYLTTLVNH